MQYFSSAQIFTDTSQTKHTDGPFVKITALKDSALEIGSGVIAGTQTGPNAYVSITLKQNVSIEGVNIASIRLTAGSVICYKA